MPTTYGPWQLEVTLGAGAMGVVHRVRHGETGVVAALKTAVHAGAPARRALRREATALRQLDHQAIVKIIDDGTDEPEPWYVMELLVGRTLSAVLGAPGPLPAGLTWTELTGADPSSDGATQDSLVQPPPSPPQPAWGQDARTVRYGLTRVAELCHALCHLHAAGFVHCDLKPDNVLVVDHRAVLLDFGLVATRGPRTDRESILEDARIAGTVSYMSPERASGAPFDARADLYAVGCMLYKVVAGRPPFGGMPPTQVMAAHRSTVPVPLAERVPGVPAELDQLVRELLSKDPRQRPGHAQRVLQVLARLGVEVPPWPLPATAPLYQSSLRGRLAPLGVLEQAVSALWAPGASGRAVWLSGESGAGKSRLVGALVSEMAAKGTLVLVGGCKALQTAGAPVPTGIPLELFAEPLREIAESALRDPELGAQVAGPLALLRPWLSALGPAGPAASLPSVDSAAAARHQLYSAVCDLLDAWLGNRPALIVLDDLQWADELSVGTLSVLLRRLAIRPWLVLGLMRAESDDTHLARVLPHGQALRLSRLDEDDVRAMVCDMLGQPDAPEPLLAWVEWHAGGNPLFVGECLRAAASAGVLTLVDGRWAFGTEAARDLDSLPVPAALEALVGARLEPLSPAALQVARAAAVLGRVAELAQLSSVADRSDLQTERAVDELARRGIAELQGDVAVFVHDILVERVYAATPEPLRAVLHRRAAAALSVSGEPGTLAWHRERAGDLAGAQKAYTLAAEQAVTRLQLREAELRYRDALRLSAPGGEVPLRLALVRSVLLPLGRPTDAERELREVLSAQGTADSPERLDVLLDLGRAVTRGRDPQSALGWFDEARLAALRLGRPQLAVMASSEAGAVLARLGRAIEGAAIQEAALEQASSQADPLLVASFRQRLAATYNLLGRNDEALALLDRVVESFVQSGSPVSEATARSSRANVLSFLGRFDEAIAEYQRALALQRRIGNRQSQGVLLGNWASALVQQGRHAEAEAQYREALAIHRETDDLRYEGIVLRSLAAFRLLDARLEEVLAGVDEAERALAPIGDPLWLAHCDNLRAKAHRYLGHPREARLALDRATEVYRRIGAPVELAEVLVHVLQHGIAFGEPFDGAQAELEAITRDAAPDTRLGQAREAGRHTVALHRAGSELLAGEDPANLPEVLQRRIRGLHGG